jgi:hypothetical protein
MDRLPKELQREIQSYLYIVSWRAELHYFTLLEWLKTRSLHNVPAHVKVQLVEGDYFFIYQNEYYVDHISKTNWYALHCATNDIIRKYTAPLREYLTKYRLDHIMKVWDLKASFRLFGVDVHGTMEANHYALFLIVQGSREGAPSGDTWSGCLPLETYKNACTEQRLIRIEN